MISAAATADDAEWRWRSESKRRDDDDNDDDDEDEDLPHGLRLPSRRFILLPVLGLSEASRTLTHSPPLPLTSYAEPIILKK